MFCALITVMCLAYASAQPSPSGYVSRPHYAPINRAGYPPPSYGNQQSEAQLKALNRQIDSLETREILQQDKLARLIASANANLDFENVVENYIRARIEDEQNQQNYRLEYLAARIAQIQTLRDQVNSLNSRYNASRYTVDNEVLPDQKSNMYQIKDLQNRDVIISDERDSVREEADNVNDRIDRLLEYTWDNLRYLNTLETNVRRVFDAVNRQRSASAQAVLTPNDPIVTFEFDPPFDGAPQAAMVGLVSRHEVNHGPGYGYSSGYPAIYISHTTDLWNDRANIEFTDGSQGGWVIEKSGIVGNFIFFAETPFFKEDLPVIA